MIRTLLASLAATTLGGAVCACASAPLAQRARSSASTGKAASSAAAYEAKRDADNDNDNVSGSRYDSDDSQVLDFGRAAGAAEARRIATLVVRYYQAAAAADGARACAMLYAPIAESVVEQFAGTPLRGRSCRAVMSALFRGHRRELASKLASLRILGTRVAGERGIVLMRFGGGGARELVLHRERGAWRVLALQDVGLS